MGSLMAGWDSTPSDPKAQIYQRNKSLTKEEIESYWRSRKKSEEEHIREILGSPEINQESRDREESRGELQRSSSLPLTDRKGNFLPNDSVTAPEKLVKKNDWWTSSNWAFLNEPPVIGEGPSKFKSQFHLTGFASSKSDSLTGISA